MVGAPPAVPRRISGSRRAVSSSRWWISGFAARTSQRRHKKKTTRPEAATCKKHNAETTRAVLSCVHPSEAKASSICRSDTVQVAPGVGVPGMHVCLMGIRDTIAAITARLARQKGHAEVLRSIGFCGFVGHCRRSAVSSQHPSQIVPHPMCHRGHVSV